ncbi:MAG: FAD-binding oxidoreductase, partial [Planctomycetes bacterium]|nr:FAD-binding oxidoreductase [Planctomycetota bacterium]
DPADASVDRSVVRLAKKCFDLLNPAKDLIEARKPTTKRNHSGYNIDGVCHDGRVDLARLIAGSEGTLCVITQAVLRTVDVPKVKALVQFEFKTFAKMAAAVPLAVDSGASACELMDRTLIAVAAEALPQYYDLFPSECAAVLMVEQTGESEQDVREKIAKTITAVRPLSSEQAEYFDADAQARLWKSRKDAVPLLGRQRGPAQPIAFIEDTSVDHTRLGEYIAGLEAISEKYRVEMAFYGHAGDGELHIRPYLDLSSREGLAKMKKLADEVFTLAFSLGGSASGEHADGLVRAAFIKQQFGSEYYELLKQVKKIFDADGIMNPGKIINDDPDVMTRR